MTLHQKIQRIDQILEFYEIKEKLIGTKGQIVFSHKFKGNFNIGNGRPIEFDSVDCSMCNVYAVLFGSNTLLSDIPEVEIMKPDRVGLIFWFDLDQHGLDQRIDLLHRVKEYLSNQVLKAV